MLDLDELSVVLHSMATGFPERAENVVLSAALDEDKRWSLIAALRESPSPEAGLRRTGDLLRSWDADRALVNECYRAAFYASSEPGEMSGNPLYAGFLTRRGGVVIDKWPHYFRVYESHLARFRGSAARVLEIGVYRGGSLALLRDFLGPEVTLVGVDVDPVAVRVANGRYDVELGDQGDPTFLRAVVDRHGPFDVVIDDGGHTMEQQVTAAEILIPLMADRGVYIVEDTHTSYWSDYGGGLHSPQSFIEWAKRRVDDIHGYHWSRESPPAVFTDYVEALHVYDSIVAFDVRSRPAPFCEVAGTWDFLLLNRPTASVVSELLATREVAMTDSNKAKADLDEAKADLDEAKADLDEAKADLDEAKAVAESSAVEARRNQLSKEDAWAQLNGLRLSRSWRLTAPMRRWREAMDRFAR